MNTNLMIGRSIPAEEYKEIRRQERAEMDRIQEQIDNWSNPRVQYRGHHIPVDLKDMLETTVARFPERAPVQAEVQPKRTFPGNHIPPGAGRCVCAGNRISGSGTAGEENRRYRKEQLSVV